MKPIEAGCLAIIVNGNYPENIGRVVKVVNLDSTESELMNQNVWVIESLLDLLKVRTNNHNKEFELRRNSFSLECNLLRIDSDGSTEQVFDSSYSHTFTV